MKINIKIAFLYLEKKSLIGAQNTAAIRLLELST